MLGLLLSAVGSIMLGLLLSTVDSIMLGLLLSAVDSIMLGHDYCITNLYSPFPIDRLLHVQCMHTEPNSAGRNTHSSAPSQWANHCQGDGLVKLLEQQNAQNYF